MNLLVVLSLVATTPGAEPASAGAERLARYRAGEAALRAGRNADAEKELTAAIGEKAAREFPEAQLLRGLARERLGRQKEADQDFALATADGWGGELAVHTFAAGDRPTVIRQTPTFALGTDPNEPCCDLMARADAVRPEYLEAGTAVEIVRVRKDGWVEYKTGAGKGGRIAPAMALAKPVDTGKPAAVPGAKAAAELERSSAAFTFLKVEVSYAKDEFRYPVRLTVTAFGRRHPALGADAPTAWTAVCHTPAELNPVAARLADDHPFHTAQTATFDAARDAIASVTTWLAYPRPHAIPVGTRGRHLLLSRAAQREFGYHAGYASTDPAKKFALLIQEQHNNPAGHLRQMRGLEALFADNPWLAADKAAAFLSEGTLRGVTHDIAPLTKAVPKPSDAVIARTLDSYLLTGYLAFEWKHRAGVPIIGYEDPDLYRISAKLFTGQFASPNAARHLWWQAVIARNKTMADGLIAELGKRECPILFMGGRHLSGLDPDEQKPDWDRLAGVIPAADVEVLKKWPKKGVRDFLKEAGVGYTYLDVRTPLLDPYDYEAGRAQYFDLFRAQEKGDLNPYLEKYTRDACPTVQPNTKAAAAAARRAEEKAAAEAAKPVDHTLRQFGRPPAGTDPARGLIHQDIAGGGHTIHRHVNKTDEFLRDRLKDEKGIKAASTFSNLGLASASVQNVLGANGKKIESWLNGKDWNKPLVLDARMPAPVGRTMARGDSTAVPASGVQVVLRANRDMPGGFHVHTAYPTK